PAAHGSESEENVSVRAECEHRGDLQVVDVFQPRPGSGWHREAWAACGEEVGDLMKLTTGIVVLALTAGACWAQSSANNSNTNATQPTAATGAAKAKPSAATLQTGAKPAVISISPVSVPAKPAAAPVKSATANAKTAPALAKPAIVPATANTAAKPAVVPAKTAAAAVKPA